MPGLFGTLDLGARSLQTQQQGLEVTGQNIANVNNPAYARQRLVIQTSTTVQTSLGPQGTGAEAVAITQLRDFLLDGQIQGEASISGYLQAQQSALQNAEAELGQSINTQGDAGSSQNGLAGGLADLFAAFQALSTDPASQTGRQLLLMKAADLASRFNQIDQRLGDVENGLDQSVQNDTASANDLLSQIAALNRQIVSAEAGGAGSANDLRDLREQKLEQLAGLTNTAVVSEPNGAVDVSIGGVTLVSGGNVLDSLQTYDSGGGHLLVRAQTAATPLNLLGGSLAGTIAARDGEVANLRAGVNTLATALITEVNSVHRAGFNLSGGTGANFFQGTGAGDIQVNPALLNDPSLLQAASAPAAVGDNQVALGLAQLAEKPIAGLNNQTFSKAYGQVVAVLGQSLETVNNHVEDQAGIQSMLANQRDSVSGVSLDEEMTNMMKYQQAYAASARLITTLGNMLDALIAMKP